MSGDSLRKTRAKRVDLPAPFGPTSPIRSPRLTCKDTSSNNVRPANALQTPEMLNIKERRIWPRAPDLRKRAVRKGTWVPPEGGLLQFPEAFSALHQVARFVS